MAEELNEEAKEVVLENEGESDEELDQVEKLPFPTATVVRMVKSHLDKDKIVKKDVKIAMNKWLGHLVEKVSKNMNKFPYTTVHLHEFEEATRIYRDLEGFGKEKERILAHLDAIKKDIQRLERDLGKEDESGLTQQ